MKPTNKKNSRPGNEGRREFIKKTSLAGAGLAVGTALPGAAVAVEPQTDAQPGQKGYQVTQHVIDYYKSLT